MPRKCVNSSDAFCDICGEVTFKSGRRSFRSLIKKCYEHYFGCKVGDQEESWAPHFCCVTFAGLLAAWAKGSRCMPYGLEKAHGPCLRLPLLHDQYHWCNSIVQTHCSVFLFTICYEASTSQCGVTCAKATNKYDTE
jgi:hypothetical protein